MIKETWVLKQVRNEYGKQIRKAYEEPPNSRTPWEYDYGRTQNGRLIKYDYNGP